MSPLPHLNATLAGVWFGMYLFTTFVVSPAFHTLFPDAGTRRAHRLVLGRQYARVNGLVTLALLVTLTALSVAQAPSAALLAQWLMLVLLCALIALHVRFATRQSFPPRWITHATLLAGLGLCAAAVGG
ncbi:hypothetical protein [Deinococcus humi]|uniref:TMEM205-like domain-containing protein n=1 Tax=Deinococcus humi TaxID=662880 RepID=A0A7W8NFF1_9DEIO|nr:hypothetical protein [Deinococcus humi]MBB5363630.1 hypothetical protein [Deinococcus humi]GGO29981.1 hypothetical protein GCM10008949_24220 [Deinococcus humi]